MSLQGHDVRIEQDNKSGSRVFIDGTELKGVRDVSYRNYVGEVPSVAVEFIPGTLNFERDSVVTGLEDGGAIRKYKDKNKVTISLTDTELFMRLISLLNDISTDRWLHEGKRNKIVKEVDKILKESGR